MSVTPSAMMIGAYYSGLQGPLGIKSNVVKFRRVSPQSPVDICGRVQLNDGDNACLRATEGCSQDENDCTILTFNDDEVNRAKSNLEA